MTTRFGRAVLDRKIEEPVFDLEFPTGVGECSRRFPVGLDNVIDVEVAPAARRLVHNLEHRGLSGELAHIPRFRRQCLAAPGLGVRPGGSAHDPAVDEQAHAGFLRVFSPADEEAQELALDDEGR